MEITRRGFTAGSLSAGLALQLPGRAFAETPPALAPAIDAIRAYAEAMLGTVEAWVPACFEAFSEYRMGAVTLSSRMLGIVKRMLAGEAVRQEGSGLSKREWRELMEMLGREAAG